MYKELCIELAGWLTRNEEFLEKIDIPDEITSGFIKVTMADSTDRFFDSNPNNDVMPTIINLGIIIYMNYRDSRKKINRNHFNELC